MGNWLPATANSTVDGIGIEASAKRSRLRQHGWTADMLRTLLAPVERHTHAYVDGLRLKALILAEALSSDPQIRRTPAQALAWFHALYAIDAGGVPQPTDQFLAQSPARTTEEILAVSSARTLARLYDTLVGADLGAAALTLGLSPDDLESHPTDQRRATVRTLIALRGDPVPA